jgi:hypothetical protein
MSDRPDVTKRQEQVLRALMAEMLAADINPAEVGGLADHELAQRLGVSEDEIRDDLKALEDLGFIEPKRAESAMEDGWFRQVECDWQWPDGRYCDMTVHFYALAASSPQTGHTDVEASLAGYCSLEHANATPRPTLAAAQRLYEEIVEGAVCVCGHCTADSFGAKAIHKLIDAYPDPIAVTDVEDYEEKIDDRAHGPTSRTSGTPTPPISNRTQGSGCTGKSARTLGPTISRGPIRDADTNPDIWLHARDLFDPRAASQCYPHVFATLLGDLDGTGATVEQLTEVLPDDDWLEFLMLHIGTIKCEPEGALTFFVTEIIEQMLRRINERYPVTKGYSPVHIALVAVYRAIREAHDEVADEEIV